MIFLSTARARVPEALQAVTSRRHNAEVDPREAGMTREGVEGIWSAVERLYRSGIHPAIQLCIRREGRVVLDRAIGHASGNGPNEATGTPRVLATPDTPFLIFSVSKPVTAMVIHSLDERRLLHLDDRVCEYIPEFAAHGKQCITLRHLLTHRAGVPAMPPRAMDLAYTDDPDQIIGMLCDARPLWRAGARQGYHALSGGFILGEVVRRVTGQTIRKVLEDNILRPLGLRGMNYGYPQAEVGNIARSYLTGPPLIPLAARMARRALTLDYGEAVRLCNDPRFLTAIIPSGNVVATADEACRFFQMLLNEGELDGVRVFEPRTVRRAVAEQSFGELDLTIRLPMRYSMGFMLGGRRMSLYGPDTEQAFGHMGLMNVLCWADPQRKLSVALLTSGKPILYLELGRLWDVLKQISRAAPTVA